MYFSKITHLARCCPSSDPEQCRYHGRCWPTSLGKTKCGDPPPTFTWRQNAAVCFTTCPTEDLQRLRLGKHHERIAWRGLWLAPVSPFYQRCRSFSNRGPKRRPSMQRSNTQPEQLPTKVQRFRLPPSVLTVQTAALRSRYSDFRLELGGHPDKQCTTFQLASCKELHRRLAAVTSTWKS